jgi:heme/copper-type cytochrome/quinol oxidase subunit 2
MHNRGISIWFFIGLSLLVNGLLITGAGIWEFLNPPAAPAVALFHLHANIWWGAILAAVGLVYCVKFAPVRQA